MGHLERILEEKGKEFQEVKELVEQACQVAKTVRVAGVAQADGIRKMGEIRQQLNDTRKEHREIMEQTVHKFQKLEEELHKKDSGHEGETDEDDLEKFTKLNIHDDGAESGQLRRCLQNRDNLKSQDCYETGEKIQAKN